MRWIRLIFAVIFWGALATVLYYALPSRDVVYIVSTEVARVDYSNQNADTPGASRDVRFINAAYPDGSPRVYRNEDTDWNFPWYLKFDSANLAAEAENLKSSPAAPVWVVVTHYGWRVPVLSMFPNALAIREVAGPDVSLIPWFNIVFVTLLVLGLLILRRIVIIAFQRHVDPVIEGVEGEFRDAGARVSGGLGSALRRLFGGR